MKHFDVVTIFPAMMDALADHGITARSLDEKRYELKAWDPAVLAVDERPRVRRRRPDRPPELRNVARREAGAAVAVALLERRGELQLDERLAPELLD